MTIPPPLEAEQLRRTCDIEALDLRGTDAVEPLGGLVGQARAEEAIALAIGMRQRDYNVFVLGSAGAGKHTLVRSLVDARAVIGPLPNDCCYVHPAP